MLTVCAKAMLKESVSMFEEPKRVDFVIAGEGNRVVEDKNREMCKNLVMEKLVVPLIPFG